MSGKGAVWVRHVRGIWARHGDDFRLLNGYRMILIFLIFGYEYLLSYFTSFGICFNYINIPDMILIL